MTTFDIFLVLNGLYFIIAAIISFFIPGNLIITRLKLSSFVTIVLSTMLGAALWIWQGYIFGYLNIRWLSYIYLLVMLFLWIKLYGISLWKRRKKIRHIRIDYSILLLLVIGSLAQILFVWFMGMKFDQGILLCCGHYPDNMLELGIIQELLNRFPPYEPGAYGIPLQNYHYLGHLLIADMIRVFHLPFVATTYQYMSIFISVFLGLTALAVTSLLGLPKKFSYWFLFFLYFGGDASYLLMLFLGHGLSFQISGLESGVNFLTNYPRAIAIDIFFVSVCFLILWLQQKKTIYGVLVCLTTSILIGLKVYVGIFALSGFGALFIYYCFKKQWRLILPFIVTVFLAFAIYLPVNHNAGGLFFTGTWRYEDFLSQKPLGLVHLVQENTIYRDHNNIPRLIEYFIIFTGIYFFSIFGTKLLGLIQTKKSLHMIPREINIFLLFASVVSLIGGTFFLQHNGVANTFNFLVNIYIIGSIYTALACYTLSETLLKRKKILGILFIVVIIVLTLPRCIFSVWQVSSFLLSNDPQKAYIFNDELEALSFLRDHTPSNSLILTDRELSINLDTPYVNLFSERPLFLAGEGNELGSHGINYHDRLEAATIILKHTDPLLVDKYIHQYKIDYIYLRKSSKLGISEKSNLIHPVFENNTIKILRVTR